MSMIKSNLPTYGRSCLEGTALSAHESCLAYTLHVLVDSALDSKDDLGIGDAVACTLSYVEHSHHMCLTC